MVGRGSGAVGQWVVGLSRTESVARRLAYAGMPGCLNAACNAWHVSWGMRHVPAENCSGPQAAAEPAGPQAGATGSWCRCLSGRQAGMHAGRSGNLSRWLSGRLGSCPPSTSPLPILPSTQLGHSRCPPCSLPSTHACADAAPPSNRRRGGRCARGGGDVTCPRSDGSRLGQEGECCVGYGRGRSTLRTAPIASPGSRLFDDRAPTGAVSHHAPSEGHPRACSYDPHGQSMPCSDSDFAQESPAGISERPPLRGVLTKAPFSQMAIFAEVASIMTFEFQTRNKLKHTLPNYRISIHSYRARPTPLRLGYSAPRCEIDNTSLTRPWNFWGTMRVRT